MGGEAIFNFMRRHQSCHNYHLPSPAQEKERPRPPLSPACFTNKHQQIYRELFMRTHQSYHNYHLHSPAQETERPRPPLSPACFTHKFPQIYRELFALPPSLGKIWAERQSLILSVGIKVVTTTICPLTHKETERQRPPLSPACFTHKQPQIYRELFALPPSLGKIRAERQSLIICIGISCHNYHLPPPAQEKERPHPPLSPACFTHKHQEIYRELFMRRHQSNHNYHLPSPAQETKKPRPLLSPACFTQKFLQIYRELFAVRSSM